MLDFLTKNSLFLTPLCLIRQSPPSQRELNRASDSITVILKISAGFGLNQESIKNRFSGPELSVLLFG